MVASIQTHAPAHTMASQSPSHGHDQNAMTPNIATHRGNANGSTQHAAQASAVPATTRGFRTRCRPVCSASRATVRGKGTGNPCFRNVHVKLRGLFSAIAPDTPSSHLRFKRKKPMRIGILAEHTGTTVPTIRYYEQIGLLRRALRQSGGQRTYDNEDLRRLGFIRACRDFGFSIDEVRTLLSLANDGSTNCTEARDLARVNSRRFRQNSGSSGRSKSPSRRLFRLQRHLRRRPRHRLQHFRGPQPRGAQQPHRCSGDRCRSISIANGGLISTREEQMLKRLLA